jgi:tetratricopeptide (TPR) repeat protein
MNEHRLREQAFSQGQTAGDVAVTGNENPFALVNATGNAAIDQSHYIIYNYYYRNETRVRSIAVDDPQTDALPCPYRGLFHFGPEDAEYFFGRKVFVQELLQVVQTRAFIPVLGASGSGKSSVVFAGIVPLLQQTGHWQFTYFRPGSDPSRDPFQALAQALVPLYAPEGDATDQMVQARKLASHLQSGELSLMNVISRIQHNYLNQRVLLIADQFEELYTLCPEEATRRSFLNCLLSSLSPAVTEKAAPLVLVATMRADFLGNALSYRPLADVLQTGQVLLGAMNRGELCQVIEQPAVKLGVTFEAGLVKRILDAVADEPGSLPLLEFALTELWGRRSGKQLTHAAYQAIGEVEGALARYADEQYARLSQSEQEQVRRIFIQLVRPGEGTEDTRRLATKAELGEQQWQLVEQLADSRLVVTSRDGVKQETVEVVHEALIRNWSQLRQWMEKDRLFRAWQERLRAAMHQWEETKRDEGALLRGLPLTEAEEKLKERREELSPAEQNFIQQSIELRDRLHREEKARRRGVIAGGSAAALAVIIILGVGGTAWYQSKQAELNSDKAKYYSQGLSAAILGNKQGALRSYQKALRLDPKDAIAYDSIGIIHHSLRDNQRALNDYNQALRLDPKLAFAYSNRGNVRRDLGDKQGALADYNQALRLDPKNALAYHGRGIVRREQGDKQGALADYNQALRLDSKLAIAYNNRGNVRRDLGDKQGALDDYNRALRLDPKYALADNNRKRLLGELAGK